MIDVTAQINAVRRQVGTRTLEAGEARVSTISQTYDAPIEDVWDACTSAERIPRWFLPISGELKLGGRYQLEGNAGGTVESCDPPHSFSATWEMGGMVSWIEVRLSAVDGDRTRFELEHVAHVDDDMWAQFGPGAVGVGWDGALLGLASHFASDGAGIRPEDAEAWMASEEGRRFMALASERWGEASIAAGTDPDAARAAAERCTQFYTGAPA
ncbi:SRPBCC family protein [Micromonospora globbae]|uniref:SRPBCC family protein n=1 Tax=Micromonospora globbae TaxID=1894969 RepID=A0A420F7Y2_9ACTN|nr:SRPBCC family protein [Micromonospora globbae]RKF29043.1 SRPBCC family protein [Micromonospora globbae]WTF84088.1 SRPBCC family protein [Micromonospora globbae]